MYSVITFNLFEKGKSKKIQNDIENNLNNNNNIENNSEVIPNKEEINN